MTAVDAFNMAGDFANCIYGPVYQKELVRKRVLQFVLTSIEQAKYDSNFAKELKDLVTWEA